MTALDANVILNEFNSHLNDKFFPCLAAHSALSNNNIRYFVAGEMSSSDQDVAILNFLYAFVDELRSGHGALYSAVVFFSGPVIEQEEIFDAYLWQRLQALADMDASQYYYDSRVATDVDSPQFSFSLKEEAFYVIGLHPASSRKARQFSWPALVWNPHVQFEHLRETNHYEKMQQTVRKRDLRYSGSINPMLADFGQSSEVFQYSGRQYEKEWKCPLVIHHVKPKSNHNSCPFGNVLPSQEKSIIENH